MSEPRKKGWGRKFLPPVLVGGAIWAAMMLFRGGFEAPDRQTYLMLLCDAFFVPGALEGGFGLLVVAANAGALDALHYGVQKLFSLMRSEEKRAAMPKTYFDFVTQKHGKKAAAPWALLMTGVAFLLAACVALLIYYQTL